MDIECREGLDIAGLPFIWSVQPLIYTLKSALKYALILSFFSFSFSLFTCTFTLIPNHICQLAIKLPVRHS